MSRPQSLSAQPVIGRWSLLRRLALTAGLAAAALLIATAIIVFLVARAQMIADYDRTWLARGEFVASGLEYKKGAWELDERLDAKSEFADGSREAAFQIWVADTTVARSRSLAGHDLTGIVRTPRYHSQWTTMPDGGLGRSQSWAFIPDHDPESPPAPEAFIAIAAAAGDLNRAIAALAQLLIWATIVGSGVSAGLMAVVATRAMQPLVELSDQLAARAPGSPQAVVLANPPRELVPVLARLNEAFGRLEAALAREKGFTADAAHELRTPLAALRLLLEVSQSEADPPDARRRDVAEAQLLVLRLQRIVDALLALARLDRGLVAPRPKRIELAPLLAEVWTGVESLASTRGITKRCDISEGLAVVTDRDLLRQILANLCDNAASHGDAGGEVLIAVVAADPGSVVVTIANEASTAPMDLSPAGQRLWRADQARIDDGCHIGIGLSLCHRIASVIQGALQMERRGSQVVVTLRIRDLPDPTNNG